MGFESCFVDIRVCSLLSLHLLEITSRPRNPRKSRDRPFSKTQAKGARNTLLAVSRRLNHKIQTAGYCHILNPYLFTLNRRLFSDTPDVCFSVYLHYVLSGRDSDVWTIASRRLIPVVFAFLGLSPGFCPEWFFGPFPTFVTCFYTFVDHSIIVLMDFYPFLCYDLLFRISCR